MALRTQQVHNILIASMFCTVYLKTISQSPLFLVPPWKTPPCCDFQTSSYLPWVPTHPMNFTYKPTTHQEACWAPEPQTHTAQHSRGFESLASLLPVTAKLCLCNSEPIGHLTGD